MKIRHFLQKCDLHLNQFSSKKRVIDKPERSIVSVFEIRFKASENLDRLDDISAEYDR